MRRPLRAIGTATAIALLATGCTSAPSFSIFGAYFPRWLVAAIAGLFMALAAYRIFAATGWNRIVPWQLCVCSAIGSVLAVLIWLI